MIKEERSAYIGCLVVVAVGVVMTISAIYASKHQRHRDIEYDPVKIERDKQQRDSIRDADRRAEIDEAIMFLEGEGYHVYSDWNDEFAKMYEQNPGEIEEFIVYSLRDNLTDKELIDIFEIGQKREKDDMPPRASLGEGAGELR